MSTHFPRPSGSLILTATAGLVQEADGAPAELVQEGVQEADGAPADLAHWKVFIRIL